MVLTAERKFKEDVKRWNQRHLHSELLQVNTKWNFNLQGLREGGSGGTSFPGPGLMGPARV